MKSLKLRDDFYWTGIIDDQLRVFDIIISLYKLHICNNSYFV